ncbi:hypothetical protein DL771_009521 [Monosporascus sp. 5C6A]|nr:hypothetical protein DL771_009521 [Monosporascus sp. 5C6A]
MIRRSSLGPTIIIGKRYGMDKHIPARTLPYRDFDFTSWIWQHVFAQALEDDCTLLSLRQYTYNDVVQYVRNHDLGYDEIDFSHVEHWVEKNMIAKFTQDCISQTLPSGGFFYAASSIPPNFFSQFMSTSLPHLTVVPTVPGASLETIPKKRIMHTLGSDVYRDNFMLLEAKLNNMKEGVFGVISYLNDATALAKGEATLRAIRWEWFQYQQEYSPFIGGGTIDVVAAWDEWYLDFMQTRTLAARDWLIKWATDGLAHWQDRTDRDGETAKRICALYLDRADALGGFNSEGYPRGTPTPPP